MREVDRVAHEVGRDPVAGLVDEEAPRQDAERVAAVHREEPAAVVRDLAQRAVGDELARVLHERRPAVVVAHAARDARPPRGALGADGLRGRAADRLLAEHVLARGGRGLDQLDVEHVRRGDEHHVDLGIVDHGPPVGGRAGEAERAGRLLAALGQRVAADHELGVERPLGKQRRDAQQRAAVGLAQPAEADDPDADPPPGAARRRGGADRLRRGPHHAAGSSRRSSCSSASISAPPDICLTSSSRVMSFLRQSPISRPRLRITKRSPTG